MVIMKKFFTFISRQDIENMSDVELKSKRKLMIRRLIFIAILGFIAMEIALWGGYNSAWKIILVITCLAIIPSLISSSRLSTEFRNRQ